MKKVLTLTLLFLANVLNSFAGGTATYRNIYTSAEVYPTGAGTIYLEKVAEETNYVKETTGAYAEKFTLIASIPGSSFNVASLPGTSSYFGDAASHPTLDYYAVDVKIKPADGYEFVCLANTLKADGIYTPKETYMRTPSVTADGVNHVNDKFSWTYSMDGAEANYVNVGKASL